MAPTAEARQALAPTGHLRVAFLSSPLYASKDHTTGELRGVAVDLGRELARRVGVPFQPVPYSNRGAIIAGAKSEEWDVALMESMLSAQRRWTSPLHTWEANWVISPVLASLLLRHRTWISLASGWR